jgi:ribosomal protein S27E
MDCTHPVLYAHNGGLYCQICGAVIDQPKGGKPLEGAAEDVTEAKEKKPRRTRKKAD